MFHNLLHPGQKYFFALGIVLLYLLLHLYTLSWYPLVHSDEVWLAWLSRAMVGENFGLQWPDLAATEDFFALTPRNPHGIKSLYHLVQGFFLQIQWSILGARLPSLLAGLGTLGFWFLGLRNWTGKVALAAWGTGMLALDPWFFAASHFGRQEIVILFLLVLGFWILSLENVKPDTRGIWSGAVVGLGVFVHPNSFIAALILVPWVWLGSEKRVRVLCIYAGVLFLCAIGGIGLSYALDPDFLSNYLALGEDMGIQSGLGPRVWGFRDFIYKLWNQIEGTYYLPPSRFLLLLALGGLGVGGFSTFGRGAILSFLGAVLGIFLIGKYSPPSGLFFVPWIYGLWITGRLHFAKYSRGGTLLLVFLVGVNGFLLGSELIRWYPGQDRNYEVYLEKIETVVGAEGRVLANLNTGFAFGPDRLRVWRDFDSLPPRTEETQALPLDERPLARFFEEQTIRWVVWPVDELDRIYRERPLWNDVYGNPYRFYPDLVEILDQYGTQVGEFSSPWYGIRVFPFQGRETGRVRVFRVSGLER